MASEAELAELRRRFAHILLSRHCARIAFRIAGVDIRPGGYTAIGSALLVAQNQQQGRGMRRQIGVRVMALPHGAAAAYRAHDNLFLVPRANYGITATQKQAVVHEATHAMLDFQRVMIGRAEGEAAAYVAGMMYNQIVAQHHPNSLLAPAATSHHGIAAAIARSLLAEESASARVVTSAQLSALLRAIRASPTYLHLRHHPTCPAPTDGGRI